jgi:hypothetical protein
MIADGAYLLLLCQPHGITLAAADAAAAQTDARNN